MFNYKEKVCLECGKNFKPNSSTQKYCKECGILRNKYYYWSNYGVVWHIDHRKPLSLFNFELPNGEIDYKQIKLANSLANLQPLFAEENLKKSNNFKPQTLAKARVEQ